MLRTIVISLFAAVSLYGQVTVSDTLKVAAGNQNFTGNVIITSPYMVYGGVAYLPGTKTVYVPSSGAFSVTLWPNSGATPTGTTYRVTYQPRQVGAEPIAPWTEVWSIVPANCTSPTACTVAQVRTASITNPSGSPLMSPLTTAGDLLYYNAGLTRLPVGEEGKVLGVSAGLPAWVTGTAPGEHASTHASAGSDPITIAQSQVTDLATALSGKAEASHAHNGADITAGTIVADRGGLGANASAFSGVVRMSGGVATAAAIANADLPDAIDFSAKTSTKPAKSGTLAPSTCGVGEVFFDTDATAGENWLLCTATNEWTAVVGGGGGELTTYSVSSFTAPFTTQTTVTLTHNFGSTKQIVACYNGSGVLLTPDSVTIGGPSSTVTFDPAATGSCTVIGGTGLYEESFTSQTSVNLDHDYGTQNIIVRCYDASENEVEPNTVTATDDDNATVTFTSAQTGRCVVASTLADGGGGTGTVTSVGVTGITGIISVASSPVTASGTMALSLDTQTANRVLAGPTTGSAAAPTFRALVAADLPVMTGDSGSGGTQGAVPAPAAGDAAAGKYLKADGTWTTPAGGGGSGDVTSLRATGTLTSWGTVAANSCAEQNLTLTGATSGDNIAPGWPSTLEAGILGVMIPGTDVVVVRLCNVTGTGIAVANGKTFTAMILRSTL